MSLQSNFPADGWGIQSKYYDEDLLFNGTYEVISVTLDKDSRDNNNTTVTTLRKGLLLTKRNDGKYEPLNTADGYLNGNNPTHFMKDIVILGYEFKITTHTVKLIKKEKVAEDLIVPVYWSCNIKEAKLRYNNSVNVEITDAQWIEVNGRIDVVPSTMRKFTSDYGELRVLPGIQNVVTI